MIYKFLKIFTILLFCLLISFYILLESESDNGMRARKLKSKYTDLVLHKIEKYKYENQQKVSLNSIQTLEEIEQFESILRDIKNANFRIMASSKVIIPVEKNQLEEYLLRNIVHDSLRRESILDFYKFKISDTTYSKFVKMEMNKYMEVYTEEEFELKLAERKAELLRNL